MYLILYELSNVTRQSVFGVCDQVRLKPACSATKATKHLGISGIALLLLYYLGMNNKDTDLTTDAQADMHLCCTYMAYTGFLMMWLNYYDAYCINIV